MKILRPKAGFYAALAVAKLMFIAGFIFTYATSGWTWITMVFAGMALASALGFVEMGTTRVVLTDDYLEMGSIWKRRRFARADIRSVKWEKGAGVALELTAGGWAKLPAVGDSSQGVTNTIRAWLKREPS